MVEIAAYQGAPSRPSSLSARSTSSRPSLRSGVDADDLCRELDREALMFELNDAPVRYCSLRHLRAHEGRSGIAA